VALSPQRIRDTHFKTARRGYDPAEVDAFIEEAAAALESAQNEATAMEARARAAVARLQELSQGASEPAEPAPAEPVVHAGVDEAETISRTLLLAQRTADTTIAEARAEADRVLDEARQQADGQLDGARAEATRVLDEAKADARRAGEAERVQVEGEVQALLARRDFLESDVDHLEQHIVAQRERITEAAAALTDVVQRVPGGLGDVRRPLLSASADDSPAGEPDAASAEEPEDIESAEIAEITRVASSSNDSGEVGDVDAIDELFEEAAGDDHTPSSTGSLFEEDGANPQGSSDADR
jgi:DivIVA domain-containing protein